MLNRQEKDLLFFASIAKLGAIGVLFPAHVAQQLPIAGTKRDKITTAAMVWAEDQFLRLQLSESLVDVGRAKSRAIPAHRHYFVVAQLRDAFDRVFKASRETSPGLPMNAGTSGARALRGREQMNINRR